MAMSLLVLVKEDMIDLVMGVLLTNGCLRWRSRCCKTARGVCEANCYFVGNMKGRERLLYMKMSFRVHS
jgi:hypothetical protein